MNTYSLSFHLIMMVKEIGKTAFLSTFFSFFSHVFFFIFLFCSLLLLSLPKLTTYHTSSEVAQKWCLKEGTLCFVLFGEGGRGFAMPKMWGY